MEEEVILATVGEVPVEMLRGESFGGTGKPDDVCVGRGGSGDEGESTGD